MPNFDLTQLPLCGAKTRSGGRCKRRGNRKNGRCKLHGGNSTGAKTEVGRMASRMNAQHQLPMWHFGEPIRPEYILRATAAYNGLVAAMTKRKINWKHVFHIIGQEAIPLEIYNIWLRR